MAGMTGRLTPGGLRGRVALPSLARGLCGSVGRWKESDKSIGSTTVLLQDGTSIEELPAVVRIINGEFHIATKGQAGQRLGGLGLEIPRVSRKLFKNINFEEEHEMILGFMRCSTVSEVLQLLEVCPETEVTPAVALAVVRRIFDLENNMEYRNQGLNQYPEENQFTFVRGAVMKHLVETVCGGVDPQLLVDTLRAMGRDTYQGDRLKYLEALCTECMVAVTEGRLTVSQVCEAARAFHGLGPVGVSYLDQLWQGLTDRTTEIGEKEVCEVMSVLPLMKKSRKHIYNMVERKLGSLWHRLGSEDVIRMLQILVQLKISHSRMLPMFSRWTSLNIHTLTEGNLRWLVYSFMTLNFCDSEIQKALGRFMKAKKASVKDPSLVTVVLDYCVKMRLRNPAIMDASALFFCQRAKDLSVPQVNSMCRSFGLLSYEPKDATTFFLTLEQLLEEKFVQFPPDLMIDLLLSCVYLKRYPLNFIKKVFNPYFFDKVHSLEHSEMQVARTKLMVLDKALCLEAPHYPGPLLPRNHSFKNFWRDARIHRCLNTIQSPLVEIVGSEERITRSAILPNFPNTAMYVVDCVVDMAGRLSLHSFRWSNNKYALLIHPPEHFVLGEDTLVGPQAMRVRHLTLCGFKVVNLRTDKITKLRIYPEQLKHYLETMMKTETL
ncbi:FAST kinase domain-containing protein 3, mitochondrial [Chionoecetes opilio]|uniref:FAST kinase domain-containing protein 3, mitochondrial n=1 Tax=Chionoecetes opilio TaxID=41210 RepID=A0A8J4YET2_CHIOP|nr:FAST kinase domain-containing protein 3, mitochondrial [Chionoecetes opilio]